MKRKTSIVYLPLIDKAPSDPATIMSAMLKARAVTETTGQEYVVFTADVGKPSYIRQYLPSPGWHASPHELCRLHRFSDGWFRYCGSAQRGVRGVLKMLTGKKYPDNVRALRMLVE